jgi:hypothetical protein
LPIHCGDQLSAVELRRVEYWQDDARREKLFGGRGRGPFDDDDRKFIAEALAYDEDNRL